MMLSMEYKICPLCETLVLHRHATLHLNLSVSERLHYFIPRLYIASYSPIGSWSVLCKYRSHPSAGLRNMPAGTNQTYKVPASNDSQGDYADNNRFKLVSKIWGAISQHILMIAEANDDGDRFS